MADSQDRRLIEAAIAAQERLRQTLGDDIVNATIAALRAQLQAASSIEHERRLVTVLFVDVVDSTRILRSVDPEETMTIMDAALQTLAEPIRAYGGRVTRFMGDGFLAVFGIKRTRENDAEMAVRAGLDILGLARTVAADVARAHNITGFQVRIGVNTGLVVTGGTTEAEDTIMGSAVNLASRIETAAPPGGMLVSQSTYRQVRSRFDLEATGMIDAKGFPEPIPVHLVLGTRSDTATTARGTEDVDVALVGRADELNTLAEAFESVVTSGKGHTVTIVGDAGIGKSRLLAEFESRLDAPVNTFRARAGLENTDVPHSLLRDLVERCFAIRSDDPVAVVQEKLATGLGARLAEGHTKATKIDIIGQFLGYTMRGDVALGPQQLRDRAVAHLIEFFQTASTSGPLLLLFDDMQWADDSSSSVLEEITEELAANPVLTLALTRPEGRRDTWEHLPNHTLLMLDPLSSEESESLIDRILSKIDACPPELRTRLLEYAGGNPYYLEELVMMCIDDGVIIIDGPAWSVRQDRLAALNVPSTLTGVIRARLDGLPSPEHTVLQQASVVGRIFWDEAITRIAGSTTTDTIDGYLHSLAARQMIDARTQSTFSHASEYAFSHTLVRDTTYEEVLLSTRREYHGIVADWLISTSGDRESEFVGLIAGHLEKAGRPIEALEYLARAAEAALNSYAITTAADFYHRALALVPDDDLERRYQLLLGRERTSALRGDRDEQRKDLDELEQVAAAIGDPAKRAAVDIQRSYLHFYTADYQTALASAQRAAHDAATAEDSALESQAQTAMAWASYYLEDWKTARTHGERALALAESGAHSEATAQNLLGMIALTGGELSEARTRSSRALHIADETGDRDGAAVYLNNLAAALTMLGDYPGAYERFSEVRDRAVENGDRSGESSATVNLAWVASATGDWEVARDHAERAISMKRRQEHREGEAEGLLWLGDALVGLERFDEAQSAFTASAEIRRELDQIALGLGARAGLARAALAKGDVAGARSQAEVILQHIDEGEQLGGTWEPLRIHLTVVEALEAAGDERAERVLRRAHQLLLEHAEKITDSDDRRCYLQAIPWHRKIADLAAALAD